MKLSYSKKLIAIILIAIFAAGSLYWLFSRNTPKAEAGWFDESWLYRIGLTVNNSGAADSNKKIKFDIDTAALITAGKMQSDCGDSRFTAANGEVLRYYIDTSGGACNTNSTDYYVLVPTINAGATAIYHYYGNTSVANGSESAQFSEATFTPTSTTSASEERGPGPVAYWKFDEGFGQTANDSAFSNNGTLGATSGVEASDPIWQTEDMCVTGKCLKFDGVDDYVGFGNTIVSTQTSGTVEAWVKLTSTHQNGSSRKILIDNTGSNYGIAFSFQTDGTLQLIAAGLSGSIDLSTTQNSWTAGIWYHVVGSWLSSGGKIYVNGSEVKSNSTDPGSITGQNNMFIGRLAGSNTFSFNGFIDDVKIYPYARTAAQIKTDYASRGSSQGVSAMLGGSASAGGRTSLSDGLVGYWKMDEASWTNNCSTASVLDASGAGNNGKACPNSTGPVGAGAGKFGNGGVFDGVDDYVDAGNATNIADFTSSNEIAVCSWVYIDTFKSTSDDGVISSLGSFKGYALRVGSNYTTFYLGNGTTYYNNQIGALSLNTWVHLCGIKRGDSIYFYKNGIEVDRDLFSGTIGISTIYNVRIGMNQLAPQYFDGSIDEVRIYNRALSPKEVRDLYNFAPGPVGWWKMDEKVSGNAKTLNDSSGYGNTGTTYWGANASGMNCSVSGKIGGGCQFDGVDDYINAGNGASLNIINKLTIGVWVKASTFTASNGIVGKNCGGGAGDHHYLLQVYPNDNLNFIIGNGTCGSGSNDNLTGTNYFLGFQNKWIFITAVYDNGEMKLYRNGVLFTSKTSTIISLKTTSSNLNIGRFPNWNDLYWNGSIDDVRIYNYARTQKQIVEDMSARSSFSGGGSAINAGAVGYWKFDEGYGITANNSGFGGASLNGTLTNMSSPATATSGWTNSGKFGKALQFDGTDDVATITNSTAIDLNNNLNSGFTISVWVNADTAGEGSGGQIFWKGTSSYLRVDTLSGGRVDVEGKLDLATTDANLNVSSAIATGAWNHIAMSYDGAAKITIWINGTNKGSNTGSGATAAESNNLLIGGTTTDNFDGAIDDFKIYSYELTEDEIKTEYNSGVATKLGSFGTTSSGAPDDSQNRAYCIPGDTATCNPPVGYWNFDEKTGTSANDITGNANVGTLGGGTAGYRPAWVSGKIGGALRFDGVDDYVDVGNGASLNLTSKLTYSIWYKRYSTSGYPNLISKGGYVNSFDLSPGNLRITGFTISDHIFTGDTNNIWHNIVFTHDNSLASNNLNIYLDGKNVGTWTDSHAFPSVANPVTIGKQETGVTWFIGIVDDIRIYNYARTPAQVAWDYNRGKPVAEWKFDECQGGTANDASGNGNNGIITIGATGTQTGLGTCTNVNTANAWYNGRNGKINSAMSFDGVDDYALATDTSNLRFNESSIDYSIFSWVKRTTTGTEYIVSKEDADNDGWRIMFNSGNQIVCSEDATDVTSTSAITDTNWHYIGCTIDRDGNGQIYIDGRADGGAVSMGTDAMATTSNIRIGTRSYTSTNYFSGLIDEVKIYNYALTPLQVKTEYNNGAVNFK